MSLDDLPIHIRANGIRRRREALGLGVDEVAAGCELLSFSVQKAEQALEDVETYRILEGWLDAREQQNSRKVVPRPSRPAGRSAKQQQQQLPDQGGPCQFELSMNGITVSARGPADKIDAMADIVRSAMAQLLNDSGGPGRDEPRR